MDYNWIYSDKNIDWNELSALYKQAPLGDKEPSKLKLVFSNSMFKCFVFDRENLIAVGRAMADGADCSYLCDIAVLPDYQSEGLGKAIVSKLVELSQGHKKILLYANPGKETFYNKFGFMKMNTAMAIFENPEHALDLGLLSQQ